MRTDNRLRSSAALLVLLLLLVPAAAQTIIRPGPAAGASPVGAAGGDLGGTYPNPTVVGLSHVTNASLPLTGLATQATNTVLGNATSGTAGPTALAVGSCSTSASALIWTTNTGFGCNSAVNAAQLGGATFGAPGAIGSGTPASGSFTSITGNSSLVLSAAGPHVIGSASVNTGIQLRLTGSFTGSSIADGLYIDSTLSPAVGGDAIALNVQPTLTKAASGTNTNFASVLIAAPTISGSGATITNAYALWIGGTPSGATNNYGLKNDGTTTLLLASDAATTDRTVCQNTTSNLIEFGSGALGVCLGTSGEQFKTDISPMKAGLSELLRLPLVNFRYKHGFGDNGARMQYGATAQAVERILPDLVGHDRSGAAINFDSGAWLFIALRAIQQLQEQIWALWATVAALAGWNLFLTFRRR